MVGFDREALLDCYRQGVFPMADSRHDEQIFLVEPTRRGVFPLDGLNVSHRLARTIRSDRFAVRIDTAFAQVIEACAAPRPGRMETWINGTIETLCRELFAEGVAHSVECWRDDRLVGGLYGLALGGAFGIVAVLIHQPLVLVIAGGVFVMEAVSVILQRSWFKYTRMRTGTGRRIFLMAPLHHHFEKKGWHESQVVMRFFILCVLCAVVALATLKLR